MSLLRLYSLRHILQLMIHFIPRRAPRLLHLDSLSVKLRNTLNTLRGSLRYLLERSGPEARQELSPPLEASGCEAGRVGRLSNENRAPAGATQRPLFQRCTDPKIERIFPSRNAKISCTSDSTLILYASRPRKPSGSERLIVSEISVPPGQASKRCS